MQKNKKLLDSFTKYCKKNPGLRFWQALVNWSGYNLFASKITGKHKEEFSDIFYWKETPKNSPTNQKRAIYHPKTKIRG